MRPRRLWQSLVVLLWLCGVTGPGPVRAGEAEAAGGVVELGDGRYRIGGIELDRRAGRFEIGGRVLPVDTEAMPIEFLAVTRGAVKAYEAVIELDTSAVEFNLACILLGLDAENATLPAYHFDPTPLRGDAVALHVTWEADGEVHHHPLGALIRSNGEPVVEDWLYTGSAFGHDGAYLAEVVGTLIGAVHDPDSIIQHRTGLGLGRYGAVTVNPEVMPATGTAVRIVVTRTEAPPVSENLPAGAP